MASTPVRIITGTDENTASNPVRIVNWNDLVSALSTAIGISNGILSVDGIQFNTSYVPTGHSEGFTHFSSVDKTLEVDLQNNGVSQQVGQEIHLYARNNTGIQINNGQVVYVSGAIGNRPTVALARADVPITARVIAIATEDIPHNNDGFFTIYGYVRDLNTQAFNEGDWIYLSAITAGAFTNAVPASPNNFTCYLGEVTRKNPANGIILFNPLGLSAFGDILGGNYSQFESDGTLISKGNATCFKDILQSVTGAQITSPAGDFQQNIAEASVTAKTSARYPDDYVTTNWQLNHDMLPGTQIFPHVHWWQTTTNTPHWVIAYRWQSQGQAKATAWSPLKWVSNAFTWTAGTLNQITGFGPITPPVNYGQVSDIVQVRLYRDYTNVSGLFVGGDPVAANQDIVNLDTHIEVNMFGSHQQYVK